MYRAVTVCTRLVYVKVKRGYKEELVHSLSLSRLTLHPIPISHPEITNSTQQTTIVSVQLQTTADR